MQGSAIRWSCLVLGLVASATTACKRDATAAQAPGNAESALQPVQATAAAAPAAAAVVAEGKSQFDETEFSLTIAPRAKLARGQAGEVTVSLTAKAPFHVNQEYPHRLKVTGAHGLTTESATIMRDKARVTPAKLELLVPVTLDQNGPHRLDGEFSFSVCTDEKCLMEKRPLSVALDAS